VRAAYLATVAALRARALPTYDVSSQVRLTKTPEQYLATRATRRELAYEALLADGADRLARRRPRARLPRAGRRGRAGPGARRRRGGGPARLRRGALRAPAPVDYAERLARAFTAEDFGVVFADADQLALFGPDVGTIRPILRTLSSAGG
jgi:hypothetical protein